MSFCNRIRAQTTEDQVGETLTKFVPDELVKRCQVQFLISSVVWLARIGIPRMQRELW